MKHIIILMGLFTFFNAHAQIERVEPPFWWEGMHYAEIQILLYGKNIAQYRVESDLPISNVLKTENPNYLFVTVDTKDKKAGNYSISLWQKKKQVGSVSYELKARREGSAYRKSFDSSDMIYLIMIHTLHLLINSTARMLMVVTGEIFRGLSTIWIIYNL